MDGIRNQRTRQLLIFGILTFLAASATSANISITPAYVDVEIQPGERAAGRFIITNFTDSDQRFRMNATHFTFGSDGSLQTIEPDDNSSADWLKFNPREFSLPAKGRRVVRFVLLPNGNLADGDYWSSIELESLRISKVEVRGDDGHGVGLNVVSSILVPVFGKVGEIRHAARIRDLSVVSVDQGTLLETVIENTGNGFLFVRGSYEILDEAGRTLAAGPVGNAYVLRSTERRFRVPIEADLPVGNHTVIVTFGTPQMDHDIRKTATTSW